MTQPPPDWRPVPDPTVLTTQQLLREMLCLREILETRLDAMDKAGVVLAETVNRTPTAIQSAIASVREVYDERFNGVKQQFTERDVRTEQSAKASHEALDAALAAAAKAAEKTEQNFTKQIDNALDRIEEIKERIDRGEGSTEGVASAGSNTRLNIGTLVGVAGLLIAVVTLVLYAVKK